MITTMPMIKVNMSLIAAFVAYCHHGSQGSARLEHLLRTRRGDITGAIGQVGSSWKRGGSSVSRLVILSESYCYYSCAIANPQKKCTLERLLRLLVANGIVEEPAPCEYLPNGISKEMTQRTSVGVVESMYLSALLDRNSLALTTRQVPRSPSSDPKNPRIPSGH